MTTEPTADDQGVADDPADLADLATTLRQLLADGLGPEMGLGGDWQRRSAVERVARLGPDELNRQIEDLYRRRHGPLVGYATRILGAGQHAEDVVNEAFRRVLQTDPDLHDAGALEGYVWSAVRNVARDRGSEATRDRAARQPHDADPPDTGVASRDRPLDEQVCDAIMLVVLLRGLSPRQRQCVVLRCVKDLSVRETAARLEISEGNVKRILHEVKARLAAARAAA